jgi:hypothetical protein
MTYECAYYTVKHYDQQISNHRFPRWLRRFLFYFLYLFLSLNLCWLLFLSLSKNLSSSDLFAAFIHFCIQDAIGLVYLIVVNLYPKLLPVDLLVVLALLVLTPRLVLNEAFFAVRADNWTLIFS